MAHSAEIAPSRRRRRRWLLTAVVVAGAWALSGLLSPVTSERVYFIWPPLTLAGWLMWRRPRPLSRRRLFLLLLCGTALGGALAADVLHVARGWQSGQILRLTYCLLGFFMALGLLRALLLSLFRRLLPPAVLHDTRLRPLGATLWTVCFAALSYPFCLSYMQVHPVKSRSWTDPRQELGLTFEDVTWQSADGTRLRGWFVPSDGSSRTAIVCHGLMDTRAGMMPFVRALHRGAFNVLVFDMRGHGTSGRWTVTYGHRERQDIHSAVDFLERDYAGRAQEVVGVGWSLGAASLILAAGDDRRLKALHVDAPYASTRDMARHIGANMPRPVAWWSFYVGTALASLEAGCNLFTLNTTSAAARLAPRPLMVVHGSADRVVPFEQGRRVFAAANAPKIFREVPRAGHCQTILHEGRQYFERMIDFLNRALADDTGPTSQ